MELKEKNITRNYAVKDNEFTFGETGRSFVRVEEGATDRQIWFDESHATTQEDCVEVSYRIKEKKVFITGQNLHGENS